MTDQTNPGPDAMDDLELITRYLNDQLTPEQEAAVRLRLATDPEFLELADPFILAWTLSSRRKPKPRPEGELERDWAEFVRRTGFPNRGQANGGARGEAHSETQGEARRGPRWRRLWPLGLLLLALGVAAFAFLRPFRTTFDGASSAGSSTAPSTAPNTAPNTALSAGPSAGPSTRSGTASSTVAGSDRGSTVLPRDTEWSVLGDGIYVKLTPGASLRITSEPPSDLKQVLLDGSARFRVLALDTASGSPRPDALVVRTRAGLVTAGESEFTVTTRADTTDVHVHANSRPRQRQYSRMMMVDAAVVFDTAGTPLSGSQAVHHIPVRDLDSARIVRGVVPQPFPKRP